MKLNTEEFLRPFRIDTSTVLKLSRELCQTFQQLAAHSDNQFLPTPISESILRPAAGSEKGRYLAIDIGGTNLRVGFVELFGFGKGKDFVSNGFDDKATKRLDRLLEKSWPILDHLKNENAEHLFIWIGNCIADVVKAGCEKFNLPQDVPLPLGVTFSFPMKQKTLSDAVLMSMGKGFAITSDLDLGSHLVNGYEAVREPGLPGIRIAAIANDAVSTLIAFVYQLQENETRKAAMGLICGTGCNATIPLDISKLPGRADTTTRRDQKGTKVAVNTEWSINGTVGPLRQFGLISKWDEKLDAEGDKPGFQPLEYMTAGRYLGELGRLMIVDYLTNQQGYPEAVLPTGLLRKFGLTTTFLSHFKPQDAGQAKLEAEFPTAADSPFRWTAEIATLVYDTAKAIERRAAGIIAASTIGLLSFAGDIPFGSPLHRTENGRHIVKDNQRPLELVVGFTGGCIAHFQDYLIDCQLFLDSAIEAEFGKSAPVRIVLSPCHDGGITGAGVLCGASQAMLVHS